jgi:N-acetylmuramoyl-L-alanine amidase
MVNQALDMLGDPHSRHVLAMRPGRMPTFPRSFRILVLTALLAAGLSPVIPAGRGLAEETPAATPAAAAAQPDTLPGVSDIRVVGDEKRTRFIADLTAPVEAQVFALADPYRVIVDLREVRFPVSDTLGASARGLITAFRYGLISPGRSRIVIDLTKPVSIDKSFVTEATATEPARIVVDMVPASRDAFMAQVRAYRDSQIAALNEQHQRMLTPALDGNGTRLKIVLDPGHGGIDTGAAGNGLVEKNVTLDFARVLGEKLAGTGRYEVAYTRNDDSFISLGGRVSFARAHAADLFISVHANSFLGGTVSGAIVYTISDKASDRMAEEVARSENQADVLAGVDIGEEDSNEVKDILVDLTRRETRNFGVVFAKNLVKELKGATRMFKIPHQTASFKVLEAPDIPSALLEIGYLSNAGDAKLMASDEWRQKTSESVVRAIDGYFTGKLGQKAER